MKINIRKTAINDLKKIDRKVKDRIHKKIIELQHFPNIPNIKKLTNFEPAYRLRIGDLGSRQSDESLAGILRLNAERVYSA